MRKNELKSARANCWSPVSRGFRDGLLPSRSGSAPLIWFLGSPQFAAGSSRSDRFSDESFSGRDVQFNYPAIGVRLASPRYILCRLRRFAFARADPGPAITAGTHEPPLQQSTMGTPLGDDEQQGAALCIALVKHHPEAASRFGSAQKGAGFNACREPGLTHRCRSSRSVAFIHAEQHSR